MSDPFKSLLSEKQRDSIIWLFTHGLDVATIAKFEKLDICVVGDYVTQVLQGKVEFVPGWTQAAFDRCDWSTRCDWILRFMVGANRKPADVGVLLGRGTDQVKRRWKELKEREVLLQELTRKRRIDPPAPNSGGLEQLEKKPKQSGFGF